MKKLLFMLLFPIALMAQYQVSPTAYLLVESTSYDDSQADTTLSFRYVALDSLQLLFSFDDSVDVDVYYLYSNGGVNWSRSDKLMDIDTDVAIDTSLYYASPEPHLLGKVDLQFAASGNDSGSTYRVWIKQKE